jgi:hypothetical protein
MEKDTSETITIKDARFGKGIFAKKSLAEGTVLLKVKGKNLSFEDTMQLGNEESFCLQVDMNKYIIPHSPFHLSNHSCDPNCGVNNNFEFITLRPVKIGEELCWDYSTSMLERHWTMECRCGSPACRKLINDFDLIPESVQEKYLTLEIVLPYIVNYLYEISTFNRRSASAR